MSFTLYSRDFIAKYSENGRIIDPALEKYVRSTSVGDSSLNLYLRYLGMFLERYELSPHGLYELRLRELRSDDPLEWEVVSGMIKRIMREMEEGFTFAKEYVEKLLIALGMMEEEKKQDESKKPNRS